MPDATGVRRSGGSYGQLIPLGFMAPAVIFMAAMFGYPLFYNIWMSLRHFTVATFLTGVAPFVGSTTTSTSSAIRPSIGPRQDCHFHRLSIAGQMTIGMLLALFFRRASRSTRRLRALLLAPWLLPLVVSASVWQWMFAQDYGVINYLLVNLGIVSTAVPWLIDPAMRCRGHHHQYLDRHSVLDGGVPLVAFRPCRRNSSKRPRLDGAGMLQRFCLIILPLLRPLTAIVFVLSVTYTVKVFDLIFVMTGGGPADATQTLAIYSFSSLQHGFRPRRRGRQRARRDLAVLRLLLHPLVPPPARWRRWLMHVTRRAANRIKIDRGLPDRRRSSCFRSTG